MTTPQWQRLLARELYRHIVLGLHLTVNSNADEYMSNTEPEGLRMTLHSPGTTVFPENAGFMLVPGYFTLYGLKYVKHFAYFQ